MPSVDFCFDFVSPNAYLAHKVIPAIEQRSGVTFNYVPVLLGGVFKLTNNQSPVVLFKDVANKRAYNQNETQRFIAKHGVPFKRNPHFPINTVTVMRGAIVAQLEGFFAEYVDAIYHSMWEEPRKMDEPAIIRAALQESDIDPDRILQRVQDQDIKDALTKSTEDAVARGIFGCPSFFVGGEMFFGKDRLREVEEEIVRQAAA
jgi:2-hydroxychromene-2-carboxylate isomerase